jgi:hypothetical protein
MPSRFDPPPGSPEEKPSKPDGIDATKRYDVYCHRHGQAAGVVYRNVLFKRTTELFPKPDAYGRIGEFIELEQADGSSLFVSRMSVHAFCEHGAQPHGEPFSSER